VRPEHLQEPRRAVELSGVHGGLDGCLEGFVGEADANNVGGTAGTVGMVASVTS
jgi:hypothetical protein